MTSATIPKINNTTLSSNTTHDDLAVGQVESTIKKDTLLVEAFLDFSETLNLILLDKFNGRSNISLALIQLKCEIEGTIVELKSLSKDVKLNDPDFRSQKLKLLVKNQHSILLYIFKRAHFWDVYELKEVYNTVFEGLPHCLKPTEVSPFVYDGLDDVDLVLKLKTVIHDGSEFAWGLTIADLKRYETMLLCCSDTLEAYLTYEKKQNETLSTHITQHHHFTTIKYFISRTFLSSSQLREDHDNKRNQVLSTDYQPKINMANLEIVKSKEFRDFRLKRIETLGLKDKKLF